MRNRLSENGPAPLGPPPARGPLAGMWEAWSRFWFRPADPTTLGLIRACVGLLAVYVHLCYSFDLQALFGPNAWLGRQTINEMRTQGPITAPPREWAAEVITPPEDPRERPAFVEFVRKYGFDPRTLEGLDAEQAERIKQYAERWSVDERKVYTKGHYLWSHWLHVTDPTWMVVSHVACLAVMVLFTLGICTRVTSVLTLLATLSYVQRAPTTEFGMDTIITVALLYLSVGASGAALSLDRVVARWLARRRGERGPLADRGFLYPEPRVSANFALRLLQIHLCIIYFASGTSKLLGASWWSGTAVWGTMANYAFSPMNVGIYVSALTLLARNRWLWELFITGATVFTLAAELGFLFLVWIPRWRWVMVSAMVLLHLGIALFMGLTMFSLIMLVMLLSFIPAEVVRQALLRAFGRLPSLPRRARVGTARRPEGVPA